MNRHTKPQSLKPSRNRVQSFIVVLSGRIIYQSESLSQAASWRDGFGAGVVYERVVVSGKAVTR